MQEEEEVTWNTEEEAQMGVSQNYGYLFGGPNNKDYSILGSKLGSPYFGKLPNIWCFKIVGRSGAENNYRHCNKCIQIYGGI